MGFPRAAPGSRPAACRSAGRRRSSCRRAGPRPGGRASGGAGGRAAGSAPRGPGGPGLPAAGLGESHAEAAVRRRPGKAQEPLLHPFPARLDREGTGPQAPHHPTTRRSILARTVRPLAPLSFNIASVSRVLHNDLKYLFCGMTSLLEANRVEVGNKPAIFAGHSALLLFLAPCLSRPLCIRLPHGTALPGAGQSQVHAAPSLSS